MTQKPFQRDTNGARLDFHGMNIVRAPDDMPAGKFPFAQNIRAYMQGRLTGRATQDTPVETLPVAPHSLRRLNDTTPAGPVAGFILVAGASNQLFAGTVSVDSGLSGNPVSLVPFRPNASVQPWMYVGDSIRMNKVRSDGTRYLMGIAEPQAAPTVVATAATNVLSTVGPVTVSYWGDSPHSGPTGNYIWKNASDPGGSGPVRSSAPPAGTTTGNSLLFDVIPGSPSVPVQWTVYTVNNGSVNTNTTAGFNVIWVSGDQFGNLSSGQPIVINSVRYIISSVTSNTALKLTTSAGVQTGVVYSATAQSGTTPLFTPALESEGYSDFNFALVGTLYVPAAGTYMLSVNSKDEFLWGIGSTGAGTSTWPPPSGGSVLSLMGQTKTALKGYPLIPKNVLLDGGGQQDSINTPVVFSAAGNYPIEIDFDYWFHSGRTLKVQANAIDIPPIPSTVITQAQYRYVYRSSATGAVSNPSPASVEQSLSVLANTVSAAASPDPQVDKIDFYRKDLGLLNYTYVGTGPNSNAAFKDLLLDADVSANPILEFDNYQPFPSIDLPRKGTVNVTNGVVTWVSGDHFNVRWLPGTIIIVNGIAYTLDKRPTSTTQLTASNVEIVGGVSVVVPVSNGTGVTYEIAEPDLAAQPLPYMWGPTDNVNFAFAVGDPLRPGTLYWCKGNNLDSAPQTNQMDVTSPSEPLQNGCIVGGLGWVASTERAWLIYPNFFNALATVQGTVGSTWTLQESSLKRGLYIPKCLAVDGGDNVFFRAKDGVYMSPGGAGGQSITDDDLYNLFPHEGMVPQPIVRGTFTIFPPDDTKPQAQKMNVANGYLYYDYQDVNGNLRTLVFDIAAMGWIVDVYQYPVSVHVLEEGAGVNGTLTGCLDGTVRPLTNTGAETATSVLLTPSFNAGDTRAEKHYGDLFVEAGPESGN